MSASNSSVNRKLPHIVILPSGIGNMTPFFQLAVMAVSHNWKVTFINIQQHQATARELTSFTRFCANQPGIELLDFEMHWHAPSEYSAPNDPFIVYFENINSSLFQLHPVLSSEPVSAIFSDFVLTAALSQISADLNIPFYVVSTTSAQFLSIVAHLPFLMNEDPNVFSNSSGKIEIQGLVPISKSNIPPTWMLDSPSNYILKAFLLPNIQALPKAAGVLLNTFDWFEPETMTALNSSRFLQILPPVFPVGPLPSYEPQKSHHLPWLNKQQAESVVYVNFGTQEVIKADQMGELAKGLEMCGYNYLWVIKDNEEGCESEKFHEFSGGSLTEGTESRSKIVTGWVDQERVLAHPAIGGFVNQCEWGSVMQAAWHGVPMVAWPQHGDQKINAETVEKAGLGIWIKDWGWGGEKLVEGKEIGQLLVKIMVDMNIKKAAKVVRKKAREACQVRGSTEKILVELTDMLTRNKG